MYCVSVAVAGWRCGNRVGCSCAEVAAALTHGGVVAWCAEFTCAEMAEPGDSNWQLKWLYEPGGR